jgi:ribosomal-protein-alanine N-acetyltransferase
LVPVAERAIVRLVSVVIEPMTERDIEAVIGIDLASFHPSDLGGRADASNPARETQLRETQLREELARTWARLFVARAPSGDVLGYVLFWHVVDEIHLLNVAVTPASRRQGIGRALVEHVIGYARSNEAARVLLEVRVSNLAAIRLYEAFGFESFNVRRQYYSDGEDGLEMMLSTHRREV